MCISWNILVGLCSKKSAKDHVSIIGILSYQANLLFLPMEACLGWGSLLCWIFHLDSYFYVGVKHLTWEWYFYNMKVFLLSFCPWKEIFSSLWSKLRVWQELIPLLKEFWDLLNGDIMHSASSKEGTCDLRSIFGIHVVYS